MAGLVPAIYVFNLARKTWMPGTRPGMTTHGNPSYAATIKNKNAAPRKRYGAIGI
jgi:hypothetical protein